MRVLLVQKASELHPFRRKPDACGLGASTFADYRRRTLAALRLPAAEPVEEGAVVEGPALVLSDDVLVTRRALAGFLKEARRRSGPSRLCLPPSRLLELFLPLQDVPLDEGRAAYEVAYVPAGGRLAAGEALAAEPAAWVAPPYREILVDVPVPRYIMGADREAIAFPLTSSVAMRVRHWLHVLRASHLMPQVELIERAAGQPLRSLLRAALGLRLSSASTMRAMKARFVYRGRGTFIHPSAIVESSVLGEGVRIGAHAYVVSSVVGDGCVVEERAHVVGSCLGPRTFVSRNSTLSACATFGDTDACINGVQGTVVAERCALTSFAHPLDIVPGGRVVVEDGGALREAGLLPCGAAFGEGVFVGAGVYVAPGRAIPAGLRLVGDPDATLRRVPRSVEPGTVAAVGGGGLRVLVPGRSPTQEDS